MILLPALESELIDLNALTVDEPESNELTARFRNVPAQHWHNLEDWAQDTGDLDASQRAVVSSLARHANRNVPPSRKQLETGMLALEQAMIMGFNPDAPLESDAILLD